MRKPLLVAEDINQRRCLFRTAGISWQATRYAWVSPLFWAALGLIMAMADRRITGAAGVIATGLGHGLALCLANAVHSLGHIVAGRLAGSPVAAVLLTSTRDVIIYRQPGAAAPALSRLGRAAGGPAASLAVGVVLLLAGRWAQLSWMHSPGIINLGVAALTILPVPSLDGKVIWSSLIRLKGGDAS